MIYGGCDSVSFLYEYDFCRVCSPTYVISYLCLPPMRLSEVLWFFMGHPSVVIFRTVIKPDRFPISMLVGMHANGWHRGTDQKVLDEGWYCVFLLCYVLPVVILYDLRTWDSYVIVNSKTKCCIMIWAGPPKPGYDAYGCVKGVCVCIYITFYYYYHCEGWVLILGHWNNHL